MRVGKAVLILFFTGLMLGIFIPGFYLKDALKISGIADILLLGKYLGEPYAGNQYFLYLLQRRGSLFVMEALLGISVFGVPMGLLVSAVTGFYLGLILSATLISGGLWGFLMGIMLLFPHELIYVPAGLMLSECSYTMSMGCWRNARYTWNDNRRYFLLSLGLLLVLLAGIFFEAYVNPAVLKIFMDRFGLI